MKTPEEYCEKYYGSEELLIPLIKTVQMEAWNEAIETASQAGFGFAYNHEVMIRKSDILKLKK